MSDKLKAILDSSLVGQKKSFDSLNVFGVTVIDSNGRPKESKFQGECLRNDHSNL